MNEVELEFCLHGKLCCNSFNIGETSWNVMAHGDVREGKWKKKLANGVCSHYSSHYLGTWCIQHYYRWCAYLGLPAVDWTDASRRFKWTRPFRAKDEIWFLRVYHHISNAVYELGLIAGMGVFVVGKNNSHLSGIGLQYFGRLASCLLTIRTASKIRSLH